MAKQIANQGRRWYAIHTYSGYEENVSQNLMQRIETMDMENKIFNVLVPKEKKIKRRPVINWHGSNYSFSNFV